MKIKIVFFLALFGVVLTYPIYAYATGESKEQMSHYVFVMFVDEAARIFLEEAPVNHAPNLVKYAKKFEEKNAAFFNKKGKLSPYCVALQINPIKALDIMDVTFGGAADALLPVCFELQLDAKLPAVKQWVFALRKGAPEIEGTIYNPLIREAWLSLLVAALEPERINNMTDKQQADIEKILKKRRLSADAKRLQPAAMKSIVHYYYKEFGFKPVKAQDFAERHMVMIAFHNSTLKF